MSESTFTTLQALMGPQPTLCADPRLTLRVGAGVEWRAGLVCFEAEGVARFDTAFNVFALAKWRKACELRDLWLVLYGNGAFELSILALANDDAGLVERVMLVQRVDLSAYGQPVDLNALIAVGQSVLAFTLRAYGSGTLTGADWATRQTMLRQPQIMLGITTFHREAAVAETAAKFTTFAQHWAHGDALHLVVVDNGRSVCLPASEKVTLIPNRNLGGSGGFARCLAEATQRGASHALFMDDDAFIDMAAIARVWAFLAYATDPACTVIGALMQGADPTRLWEAGAVFRQICHPRFYDLDLTSAANVVTLEDSTLPDHFYGGFWFFAFPLASVRHWPFPFFIRGDDIAFSLSNPFRFFTLPGVVSFQDQDFPDKQSALTLYLDLRNHLIQHLALPELEIGPKAFAYIPAFFFGRSLFQYQLDSLVAANLAVEDVLCGPDFFAVNADMTVRRATIAAARRYEVWQKLDGPPPVSRVWINPNSAMLRVLFKLSLNGLFLPFFRLWGNRLVLNRNQRGQLRKCWGAAEITYIDEKLGVFMTVRHNKSAMLALGLRSAVNLTRLMWHYTRLRSQWRPGFDALTSEAFWQKQFKKT